MESSSFITFGTEFFRKYSEIILKMFAFISYLFSVVAVNYLVDVIQKTVT